jgi:replication initiation protein RepC
MLHTEQIAESFSGPLAGQGAVKPGAVLAAFKAAAPYLGYSPRVVHAVDWLFTFTQPQDWAEGCHPIVWPSAGLEREALCLGETQAKALNRQLAQFGLVVMKDSANGKRYGTRDGKGRIIEAYGFDLAPLGARQAEFEEVARLGREERERKKHLRRRTTIACKGLAQIIEAAEQFSCADATLRSLEAEGRSLAALVRKAELVDEMELGVAGLERRQREARERLETLLPKPLDSADKVVDSDPKGAEYRPHQYNYKPAFYPQEDTVTAIEGCKSGAGSAVSNPAPPEPRSGQGGPPARTDQGTVLRVKPAELVDLAPRLRPYLETGRPDWRDIVDAADGLRQDLGISRPLWGEACLVLGRERAAIAVAIVSTKPAEHFTATPGGYFCGMIARAKRGELNLDRTIWGLRTGAGRGAPVPAPRLNS